MFKRTLLFGLVLATCGLRVSAATYTFVNLTGTNWTEVSDTNHVFPPGVTIIPGAEPASAGLSEFGVTAGTSATVWVDYGGVTVQIDSKSDVEKFMVGFSFVFVAGIFAAGMRWAKKSMVGGIETSE